MRIVSGILGVSVAAMSMTAGLEGLRRFALFLGGQQLAVAPSAPLTVLSASAVLALGAVLCFALLRYQRAGMLLILSWSGTALLTAFLGHLNHAAYRTQCSGQNPNRRCVEFRQRGLL
jgi:hypothetical protein